MTGRIDLLILDDHSLFRVSLAKWLDTEPGFHVAAHCATAAEALEALARHPVDVLLLDFDLGQDHAFPLIRKVREAGHLAKILMVTAGMPDADVVRALGLGISGIFLKHSPPALLGEAIRKVAQGETWIDQSCIQALVQAVESRPAAKPGNMRELTGREQSVLDGVCEGLSNKEIASRLGLSEASVKSAMQQLFLKASVRTRSQLVRVALEELSGNWQ